MCSKCLFVFLAGVAFMHTIGHVSLMVTNLLPLTAFGITVTPNLNYVIIAISLVLTLLFLYMASRRECGCRVR